MIPNVNQFTQQLRMLPDAILRRLAQMYKQDPYIFPMVISEDMARKKLRASAQAQAAQPQPKVNDQALMAMGEESQQPVMAAGGGLLTLKAPNMERMADGGIAGYDDMATYAEGGNVVMAPGSTPSYQRTAMSPGMLDFAQHSEPVIRMAGGGAVAHFDEGGTTPFGRAMQRMFFSPSEARLRSDVSATYGSRAGIPGMFMEQSDLDAEAAAAVDRLIPSLSKEELQALKQYGITGIRDVIRKKEPELFEKLDAEAKARAKPPGRSKETPSPKAGLTASSLASMPTAYETIEAAYGPDAERMPQPPMTTAGGRTAPGTPARPAGGAASSAPAVSNSGIAALGGATGAGTPGGAAPAAGGRMPSIYDLANPAAARAAAETLAPTNRYETAFNVQAQREREREEGLQAERARTKPTGKAFEAQEAMLKKEGEGAAKELSEAGAFALISAGLNVASGESPHALVNLAKGLNIGAKEYQAAVKDLKKSARDRELALANIKEARRAEERGDWREEQAYREKAADKQTSSERFQMSGIMQLGISQDQLTGSLFGKGVEAQLRRDLSREEQAGAMARTTYTGDIHLQVARIQAAARSDPQSKEAMAVARVQQAVNASPMLKQLAEKAAMNLPGAAEKYRAEEERLYLKLAPELLVGADVGGSSDANAAAKAAGDAILGKKP